MTRPTLHESTPWWNTLPLDLRSLWDGPEPDRERALAIESLLRDNPPQSFGEEGYTFAEMVAQLEEIDREAQARQDRRQKEAYVELWKRLDEVESLPNADEPATDPWEGFTVGEVLSWFWILRYLKPRGFAMPYGQMRWENGKTLQAGEIPRFAWNYPEKARELRGWGVTPRTYLSGHEEKGSKLYRPHDIRPE